MERAWIKDSSCPWAVLRIPKPDYGFNKENSILGFPNQDSLTWGTKEEHDRSLENVLLRLQGKNLPVNPTKRLFGVTELDYYGFHISEQGVSSDKDRIHAIKHMQPPSTVTEARSFLGLVNTVARFLPNLATITEPIRRITYKDCP